mmetsp:Transcript_3934/g.11624  ORF Transcript_3934/g.11624 Transcript_3934/m.11624 type:complete len:223 (+) Transcript_3934:617-1285(+)
MRPASENVAFLIQKNLQSVKSLPTQCHDLSGEITSPKCHSTVVKGFAMANPMNCPYLTGMLLVICAAERFGGPWGAAFETTRPDTSKRKGLHGVVPALVTPTRCTPHDARYAGCAAALRAASRSAGASPVSTTDDRWRRPVRNSTRVLARRLTLRVVLGEHDVRVEAFTQRGHPVGIALGAEATTICTWLRSRPAVSSYTFTVLPCAATASRWAAAMSLADM